MKINKMTFAITFAACATFALLAAQNAGAVLASTSSEISDSTSASTSKLFSQNEKERLEKFVEKNSDRLQEQAARGSGAILSDYVSLIGCKNSGKMGKAIQENYTQIFSSDKSEIVPQTEKLLNTNASFALACEAQS